MKRHAAALALVLATGCQPQPLTVPSSDPTAPSAAFLQATIPHRGSPLVSLNGTAQRAEVGETDHVPIYAHGDDNDGGVRDVRIWATRTTVRGNSISGPSIAGAPEVSNRSTAGVGDTATKSRDARWTLDVAGAIGTADRLSVEIWAEVENFHGGTVSTAHLTLFVERVTLGLHVVALSDDDGGHAFQATAAGFDTLVDRLNVVFGGTGIRFAFDPATDWEERKDTTLNRQTTGWPTTAQTIATAHPDRIVLILRWGDGADRTGNGNAFPPPGANPKPPSVTDSDQPYVMLPDLLPEPTAAQPFAYLSLYNGSWLAHEIGHYLGLYHTFPGFAEVGGPVFATAPATAADADKAIVDYAAANGSSLNAFDGDGIDDTPPDPGGTLYDAHGQRPCTTREITATSGATSYTFEPDITNVMSYHATCNTPPETKTFTFGQIQAMHHALRVSTRLKALVP